MNKWTLKIKNYYICNNQEIIKTHIIAIPPSNGNRIDVIGEHGKYYYGILERGTIKLIKEEFEKIKDSGDMIAIIIEIKNGNITII